MAQRERDAWVIQGLRKDLNKPHAAAFGIAPLLFVKLGRKDLKDHTLPYGIALLLFVEVLKGRP